MTIPTNHVEEILNRSKAIHLKKREDYASDPTANPFENFDRANGIISWFPAQYASFASHIGTKLARLGSLLTTGKTPNNEALDDTFLDLITYCALFYGYWKEKQIDDSEFQIHRDEIIYNPIAKPIPNIDYSKSLNKPESIDDDIPF